MNIVIPLLFLLLIIIDGNLLGVVQCADDGIYRCIKNVSSTSETGHLKLKAVRDALDSLPGDVTNSRKFVNLTAGQNIDAKITAVAFCYGFTEQEACGKCVSTTIKSFTQFCPQTLEAVAWYLNCMVRYSDRKILGVLDSSPSTNESTTEIVTDFVGFDTAFKKLTTRLQLDAAGGDTSLKLAVGDATYGEDSSMIYAMMQCTPDLSAELCSKCLISTITAIHDCCMGKVAATVFYPNCFLRYSNEKFYDTASMPFPSSSVKKDEKSSTTRMSYIIVPLTCIFLLLTGIGVWLFCSKRQPMDEVSQKESTDDI